MNKNDHEVDIGLRKFLKGAAAAGLLYVIGCHGKSSNSPGGPQETPEEKLKKKFVIGNAQYQDNATSAWNIVGNGGTPSIKSGERTNFLFTYRPLEDLTLEAGFKLSKDGKVEWDWYSQPLAHTGGVQVTTPFKDVPVLNDLDSASKDYQLECRVRNSDTGAEATLIDLNPAVTWGGNNVATTYQVDEALAYLKGKNLVGITADNAGADDINTLADITGEFPNEGKTASQVPVLDGSGYNGGFLIGMPADNPRVNDVLSSVPVTDAGYLTVRDLKDGGLYVVVTGTAPDKTRIAGRVVKDNDLYDLFYKNIKVTGDLTAPVVTEA